MGNEKDNDDFGENTETDMEAENRSSSVQSDDKGVTLLCVELSSAIFKLNVDCFHEVFDWLSLKDLTAVGKTCKRLKRIAGHFIQSNYSAKSARGKNDGIYMSSLQSNIFSQYIQKISISGDRLEAYRFVGLNCAGVKHIRVYGSLPDGGFEHIKKILQGVEVLEMNECIVKGEFHRDYLNYCPNLKSLNITRSGRIRDKSISIGTGNEWLLRKYPKLEHFELIEFYKLKMNELQIFFEQNPNVRTFSTDSRGLWENRHSILGTNIKLDTLVIDMHESKLFDSNDQPISMVDSVYYLLNELYDQGFYKHLHFYLLFVNQKHINQLCFLRGIEMLNGDIDRIDRIMPEVKVLAVWCGDEVMNLESIPSYLPNLERISMWKVSTHTVATLIQIAPQLRQIRFGTLKDLTQFRNMDLVALNKQRGKTLGARKVIIYLKEDIYLAMKWTRKSIDFNFIELRRYESNEWEEYSSRAKYIKSF